MIATLLSIESGNVARWVWKTSLEATLLIGVIFLIGWAVGRRPRWRYVLGLLILARLVLPLSLPGVWGFNGLVPNHLSEPSWSKGFDTVEHFPMEAIPAQVIVQPPTVRELVSVDPPARRSAAWTLSGLWAAGALMVFAVTMARMIQFTIRLRRAAPVVRADCLQLLDECRACLRVRRVVTMLELRGLGTPALYGVFRPKLLLPHGFLDRFSRQEVRLVFLHELAHLKAHDILLNWLIAMAGAIHWFNPATWLALRRLCQDREILRDAQVLHRLDPKERTTYGQTLLKLSEQLAGGAPCPSFIPVVNHRSQISRRILMITRYRRESLASNIGLVAVIVALALATFSTPGNELVGEATSETLTSHAWSQDSEFIRVEKTLLERISIRPVTITNSNTRQFVLTPEFNHAFLLAPEEIARVNTALTNALHEYRTVQGQHLKPIDGEATFENARRELPYAEGTFAFSLKPFVAEARGIREKLKSEVVAALATQRAEIFWQEAEPYLDGEMNMASHARIVGQTHSFSVLTRIPGPLVDLTVTYEGGSHAGPYGEALDPYAPEKLRPILKRWREWIAGQPPGSFAWSAPESEQTVIRTPPGFKQGKWDDASEYVDLPKPVVRALKVPGLTDDEEVSPEAIAILGLSTNDVHAVNELYQQMKLRTEAVERGNLVKPDPDKTSFILRAFPDQAAAFHGEWLTGLAERIGASRAELLDQFIRTPIPFSRERIRASLERSMRGLDPGPRWFDRGQFDLRIDVEEVMGPNGRDALRIRYESDSPESGDLGGSREKIPLRFRHLLTPEMLDAPEEVVAAPSATVAAGNGDRTASSRSKFEFELPGVPDQMIASQSSQNLRTMDIARSVIIPSYKLQGAAFLDAFMELIAAEKQNSREDRHIDFRLIHPQGAQGVEDLRVTLNLEKVSLAHAAQELARLGDFELQEVNDWERKRWGLIFIPRLATPRFEPGTEIKTLRDTLHRLKGVAVTQFDDDAPGLRAAYLSGFESSYIAAFLGDTFASRVRWAPTHDRPSFARQVGFMAGERAAFEFLLEGIPREHKLTSVGPSAAGDDTPRESRSK